MELKYSIEEEYDKINKEYGIKNKDRTRSVAIEALSNRCFEKARQEFLRDPYTSANITISIVGDSVNMSLKRG
ncbi:MAG: hypothetical protein ACRC9P_10075 [Bacteroides sp.]